MRILAPLMMGSTLMELGTNYIFRGKRGAVLRHLLCLTTFTQLKHSKKKRRIQFSLRAYVNSVKIETK
jgi:hypothetical protein